MENFKASGIYTKQAHVKIPDQLFEEEHGRKGFFGRVSQLYHEHQLTAWSNIEGPLKPRSMPPSFEREELKQLDYIQLLYNQDVSLWIGKLQQTPSAFTRNADADELLFIHQGQGRVETSYGPLNYKKGDYIIIPRGTTYKLFPEITASAGVTEILKIESQSEFEQPSRGILGPNALYDQTAIEVPQAQKGSEQGLKEYVVQIKHLGQMTKVTYPFNPLDVVGWKGSIYPWKVSIYDYCPINSHKYHIPPSGHTMFVAKNFVICSFVARPLEHASEQVLKVPFYHLNIDYDEVLFYHAGSFFSRDGIGPGALTFHPQGIHHGPHPKAFARAEDKLFTDEFAVMLDTRNPLKMTAAFEQWQTQDYWKSWMTP